MENAQNDKGGFCNMFNERNRVISKLEFAERNKEKGNRGKERKL